MSEVKIRKAQPEDAEILTQIAIRSKAYWGYPQTLIEAWKEDLTITPEFLKNGIGYVAELDNHIVGFWVRAAIQSEDPSLEFVFIEPNYIKTGIGRRLFEAVRVEALKRGIQFFVVESDPNAVGFYYKLGAIKMGEKESAIVPGRKLPIIKIVL